MTFIKEFFEKEIVKKVLVLLMLAIILFLMKDLINLFLLTFLFTYLIYHLRNFILSKLPSSVRISDKIITAFLYLIIILMIALMINEYIPTIIDQSTAILDNIKNFKGINSIHINSQLKKYILPMFEKVDIKSYVNNGASYVIIFAKSIGIWSFYIFASLMLSMIFMFEEKEIKHFVSCFEESRIAWIYKYLKEIGHNFLNSFGKVIQVQILIALVNTILSLIALGIMGFPQLFALGAMIFVLSLIPVAGVIISLIPLTIIAFQVGGIIKVFSVLIMIAILHAIESYVLNPKLMSDKTKLPVFFTFVILIVSKYFMGTWGLLIGIPLFMFFLDLLNVKIVK